MKTKEETREGSLFFVSNKLFDLPLVGRPLARLDGLAGRPKHSSAAELRPHVNERRDYSTHYACECKEREGWRGGERTGHFGILFENFDRGQMMTLNRVTDNDGIDMPHTFRRDQQVDE